MTKIFSDFYLNELYKSQKESISKVILHHKTSGCSFLLKSNNNNSLVFNFIQYFASFIIGNQDNTDFDITLKNIKSNFHPNFQVISKDDSTSIIKAQNLRVFIKNLCYQSINGMPIFVVINTIDDLNMFGINSILKTLEEPFNNLYLFCLTACENKVIETVKSRLYDFYFQKPTDSQLEFLIKNDTEVEISFNKANNELIALSGGNYSLLKTMYINNALLLINNLKNILKNNDLNKIKYQLQEVIKNINNDALIIEVMENLLFNISIKQISYANKIAHALSFINKAKQSNIDVLNTLLGAIATLKR